MKKILNILLAIIMLITVILTIYAVVVGGNEASINLNLFWSYILIVGAIATALFCACWGMIKNPAGIKGSLISLVLIVAIVVVSYLVANGHTIQIPDIAIGGFFPRPETIITETSILVSYVVMGGAILTAVLTEIYNAFK